MTKPREKTREELQCSMIPGENPMLPIAICRI